MAAVILLVVIACPEGTLASDKEKVRNIGAFGHSAESFHPSHRFDVSRVLFDAESLDALAWVLTYTHNLTAISNISITIDYIDSDLGASEFSGFGDSLISFSYTPFTRISASPWVPKNVGIGMDLLLPTGNVDEGRSVGTYIFGPYVGFVFPVSANFTIAPNLTYYYSSDEDPLGLDIRTFSANINFTLVCCNNFWVAYIPEFLRDNVLNDTGYNHNLVVGKMFSDHIGVSAGYSALERVRSTGFLDGQFDDQLRISLHITF